jgi:hypothetical protein
LVSTKSIFVNNITDFFTENVRIECKFGNYLSPKEYWNLNKKNIIKNTLKKYNIIDIYHLRETIYNDTKLFKTKFCNNFRITLCMTILNYFKPEKWLDISAGWGDRLLSAIFCKIKLYVATDPNLDLHPGYEKIINTFVLPSKRLNYNIFKNGFLEASLPNEKFDIVFSSPPFFTLEIYSSFSENSVSKYKSEKEWCNHFFIPSLIKAYNYVKKNGHMILYMGGSNYVMESMHKLDKVMKYKGIIYFYENKPRAIYVWQKMNDNIYLSSLILDCTTTSFLFCFK